MKFIYTAGQYTCFMGRMFAFKKPTEISDKATIAALLKHQDFMRVDDAPTVAEPAPSPVRRQILGLRKK